MTTGKKKTYRPRYEVRNPRADRERERAKVQNRGQVKLPVEQRQGPGSTRSKTDH